jgi:sugar O-acyltransferase (sialic acid O-acetyltransferase NeuD family)
MKDLLIIGAGGFGREVFGFARDNPEHGVNFRVKGFLDSRTRVLDEFPRMAGHVEGLTGPGTEMQLRYRRDVEIVGDPLTYDPKPNDVFVCAIGDPAEKRKYASSIVEKGGEFINLIHHLCAVSVYMKIGHGCIIAPYASVSVDTIIGNFVAINGYAGIGHDVRIGDWVEIDGHCLIAGGASIGAHSKVHAGAIVLPRTQIGEGVTVGAGSVVMGRVPDGITVFGNPAKRFSWKQS